MRDTVPNAFAEKIITAEQAAQLVRPGNNVFIGTACAAPRTILAALEGLSSPPPDICIYHFLTTGMYEGLHSPPKTKYYHRTFYIGTDMKPFVPSGAADYVPIRLMSVPRLLENKRLNIDVAFIQVTPPDENGFVSLGVSVDITMAVVRHARLVVAELNPQMPRTHGDTFVHQIPAHVLVVCLALGLVNRQCEILAAAGAAHVARGPVFRLGLLHRRRGVQHRQRNEPVEPVEPHRVAVL